jgi:HSP20 family molecular chaperone IbpA
MSKVVVQEGHAGGNLNLILDEIRKRFEDVRRRAHEFFEKRQQHGGALDDWVKAEREFLGATPTELSETSGAYRAEVALPGFEAANVSVTVTPDEIIVHASKAEEQRGGDTVVLWTELGSREVYRRIETPEPIDTGNTTATLEKGILRIVAPKSAPKSAVKCAPKDEAKTDVAAQAAKTG